MSVQQPQMSLPRTVTAVQPVSLALVSYVDERGITVTQLAVVGENNVNLLESRALGFSKSATPQGSASKWLVDGVRKLIKKDK